MKDRRSPRREFQLIDDGGIGRRVVMVEIRAAEVGPDPGEISGGWEKEATV